MDRSRAHRRLPGGAAMLPLPRMQHESIDVDLGILLPHELAGKVVTRVLGPSVDPGEGASPRRRSGESAPRPCRSAEGGRRHGCLYRQDETRTRCSQTERGASWSSSLERSEPTGMNDVMINKAASIQRCVRRARDERAAALRERLHPPGRSVTRACEQAIDLANHRQRRELRVASGRLEAELGRRLRRMVSASISIRRWTSIS